MHTAERASLASVGRGTCAGGVAPVRYESDWAVWTFKRTMDALYAATAASRPAFDWGGPLLGVPAAALAWAYYGLANPTVGKHEQSSIPLASWTHATNGSFL